MENQTIPCKALVLAGGGARGSYQVGVWKALIVAPAEKRVDLKSMPAKIGCKRCLRNFIRFQEFRYARVLVFQS